MKTRSTHEYGCSLNKVCLFQRINSKNAPVTSGLQRRKSHWSSQSHSFYQSYEERGMEAFPHCFMKSTPPVEICTYLFLDIFVALHHPHLGYSAGRVDSIFWYHIIAIKTQMHVFVSSITSASNWKLTQSFPHAQSGNKKLKQHVWSLCKCRLSQPLLSGWFPPAASVQPVDEQHRDRPSHSVDQLHELLTRLVKFSCFINTNFPS